MGPYAPYPARMMTRGRYDAIFAQMGPENGLVSGAKVAPVLKKSGLANDTLRDIWNLVDVMKVRLAGLPPQPSHPTSYTLHPTSYILHLTAYLPRGRMAYWTRIILRWPCN